HLQVRLQKAALAALWTAQEKAALETVQEEAGHGEGLDCGPVWRNQGPRNGPSTRVRDSFAMNRRLFLFALVLAPPASRANEEKSAEKKKGGGPDYIQIPTLTATIMRRDGRRGVLTVEVGVDVPDRKLRELAEAS